MKYPQVLDKEKVGKYPALAKAGGGYVWDDVLEYRVWMSPSKGAPDDADGDDYYYVFTSYQDAKTYSDQAHGAEKPLALIIQREYIDEPNPGEYHHIKEERVAEWPVEFLNRPRRTANTIPDFMSPDAPANRLDIIRGLA